MLYRGINCIIIMLITLCITICSHSVNSDVGVCGTVVERGSLPEVFSKLMLPDIKAGQLSADVVHLFCLQWRYILLHHY